MQRNSVLLLLEISCKLSGYKYRPEIDPKGKGKEKKNKKRKSKTEVTSIYLLSQKQVYSILTIKVSGVFNLVCLTSSVSY